MIDREKLKKGDHVLVVGPRHEPYEAVVMSLGRKYIGVSEVGMEELPAKKFTNDGQMECSDWSAERLFLGTLEELKQAEAERDAAMEVWEDICCRLSQSMPMLWKLNVMKVVMDSPTLEEAECKIHELVVYGQCRT